MRLRMDDLGRALAATLFFGAASGIVMSTFNNYLKKIAEDPADITPTISTGITIDHAVATTLPVLSGYIWEAYGFRWVFLLAGAIALVGFFVCLRIRVPHPEPAASPGPARGRGRTE